jgi:hypothetical protein
MKSKSNGVYDQEIRTLTKKFLLLPSQRGGLEEFQREERTLIAAIERRVSDPCWMDYLSYPSRYQLNDCVVLSEGWDVSIDE